MQSRDKGKVSISLSFLSNRVVQDCTLDVKRKVKLFFSAVRYENTWTNSIMFSLLAEVGRDRWESFSSLALMRSVWLLHLRSQHKWGGKSLQRHFLLKSGLSAA